MARIPDAVRRGMCLERSILQLAAGRVIIGDPQVDRGSWWMVDFCVRYYWRMSPLVDN